MLKSEYTVYSKRIPTGLSFAVVSDLHDGEWDGLFREIQEAKPDAILVPGDVVQGAGQYENGLAFLRAAAGFRPTFVSLGNHEYRCDASLSEKIADTGAVLLDDAYTEFEGIRLVGVSSGYRGKPQGRLKTTPPPDLAALEKGLDTGDFTLVLCHHPEYYPRYLKHSSADLILAGHAHGGQWRFFGRGVFAPGQGFFPRYTSGLTDGRLLVSRGLSNQIRIPRLFNRPEWIHLHIEPQA